MMKRLFLVLLGAIVVISALAGVAYAGYRIGFSDGVGISFNGDDLPSVGRPNFNFERVPFAFDRDFDRGFPPGGFERMHRRDGFGGFGLFRFFIPLTILGLLGLIAYLLFTRSGWQLTRVQQPVQNTPSTVEAEPKPEETITEDK